ncbi:MAG: hypothetical protein HWN51_02470 [Desulfobacterales bacterium]|nr:hypothetical protein [Desulfobacterales bacterium]
MTSHAALVASGWGKCCIVGCGDITSVDLKKKVVRFRGKSLKEGDWISMNGTMREMIMADDAEGRKKPPAKLLPMQPWLTLHLYPPRRRPSKPFHN